MLLPDIARQSSASAVHAPALVCARQLAAPLAPQATDMGVPDVLNGGGGALVPHLP
eukprot:CAMPEP_0117687450 /NCGR_PEP_ID=MMETSP0804-20121206/23147_1 /TAXON_ID=1074897 /ORGANISM="Tetraselmis astigmatica, Strain CCMP880" /LENGTH=55 /DNA_ID=CAMNT_0005499525 /DNA_START=836 /DNA_END=1003 /DNA_ORIENTATION=+